MFRSVRLFRMAAPWPDSEQTLSDHLSKAAFAPCATYAERSTGWDAPSGTLEALARRVGGADLLQLRTQVRLLPAAALNEALAQRLDEYRARMGSEPNRRERRKLKEQMRDELLPKALLKSERTRGLVIGADQIIAIDTISETRAERFLEYLRIALGNLEITALDFARPVSDLLTRIFFGDAPRDFVLGTECRLQDPSDRKATIRCVDMDLADPAIRKLVKDGMQLTHLGIEFRNVLRCVIDQQGAISKLRLAGLDPSDLPSDEDPLARLDAELALFTGTLRELLRALASALGGHPQAPPYERVALTA